jgi:hypothetical protein
LYIDYINARQFKRYALCPVPIAAHGCYTGNRTIHKDLQSRSRFAHTAQGKLAWRQIAGQVVALYAWRTHGSSYSRHLALVAQGVRWHRRNIGGDWRKLVPATANDKERDKNDGQNKQEQVFGPIKPLDRPGRSRPHRLSLSILYWLRWFE